MTQTPYADTFSQSPALDADAILTPLSATGDAGPDLTQTDDRLFDAVREARRQDDDLPQGVWQTERKHADWDQVILLCQKALATRTKDLRLLVWLVEALVQRDGFAALGPSITLVERFCRAFWDRLHPTADGDGDLSARINAIALLNTHLPRILRTWPIAHSGVADPKRLSWGDYETAQLYQNRTAASPDGVTVADFQACAEATPAAQLERLQKDLADALAAINRLDEFLDQTCAREAPSLEELKSLLIAMAAWLRAMLPAPPNAPRRTGDGETADTPVAIGGEEDDCVLACRDEAYRLLAIAADYLMQAEPHSPTPYLLRRILAWKDMPLDAVLQEMAHGRNELSAILEQLSPSK